MSIPELIQTLPKAELHLHIEGSLEPELMWKLAQKHAIELPYDSVAAIRKAYQFEDLQSFLDLYYQGANVLRDEQDFYDLMWAYLTRCKAQNVVHCEIMFDPQTHTSRGIAFETFMHGFLRATKQANNELGISTKLIMCFLRHLSEQEAFDTLEQAKPFYEFIDAVGLDSAEINNPPERFASVFEKAKALGFKRVAHAGEEGPFAYIWNALSYLDVDRIDHGVKCIQNTRLLAYLRQKQIPLTVCPLSNVKLCVFNNMSEHNILSLLEEDIMVTVNSDDPAYFGGYMNENYLALYESLDMSFVQLVRLVKNSFTASFISETEKQQWLATIDEIAKNG